MSVLNLDSVLSDDLRDALRRRTQEASGLALMIAVFTFNLLGYGLRDLVDPQRRT